MLGAAADIRFDIAFRQLLGNLLNGRIYEGLTLLALLLDVLHHVIVGFRVKVTKAQILQLPLHIGNAQAVGQGGIDFDGLLGDALLFVLPHVL